MIFFHLSFICHMDFDFNYHNSSVFLHERTSFVESLKIHGPSTWHNNTIRSHWINGPSSLQHRKSYVSRCWRLEHLEYLF
jgi:hypothetical protein